MVHHLDCASQTPPWEPINPTCFFPPPTSDPFLFDLQESCFAHPQGENMSEKTISWYALRKFRAPIIDFVCCTIFGCCVVLFLWSDVVLFLWTFFEFVFCFFKFLSNQTGKKNPSGHYLQYGCHRLFLKLKYLDVYSVLTEEYVSWGGSGAGEGRKNCTSYHRFLCDMVWPLCFNGTRTWNGMFCFCLNSWSILGFISMPWLNFYSPICFINQILVCRCWNRRVI